MKTVEIGNLPPGARVRGVLYSDPAHVYGLGDVLEVELPTGFTIDVGWDQGEADGAFRIVVYREYFGDRFVDFRVRDADDVVIEVRRLAREHSGPYSVVSCSDTDRRSVSAGVAQRTANLAAAACAAGVFVAALPGGA